MTRLATDWRKYRSWLTARKASGSACSNSSSQTIPSTSRWFVGSSRSSSSGSPTIARRIARRFFHPPKGCPRAARRRGSRPCPSRRPPAPPPRVGRAPPAPAPRPEPRPRCVPGPNRVLGHVPDPQALPGGARARRRLLEARQDPQQRRFPRAVRADEPHVVALEQPQGEPFEERGGAERLGQVLAGEEEIGHLESMVLPSGASRILGVRLRGATRLAR